MAMSSIEQLQAIQKRKLHKALDHLEYSYNKVKHLSSDVANLDDEVLETWESFSARFSRVSDMFLARYLRSIVLINDPGFSGSLRDFVNQGEKLGVIDDTEAWMAIRELRNISAHDYSEKDLAEFFKRLLHECPRLLLIRKLL
jgi:hypothetical protein